MKELRSGNPKTSLLSQKGQILGGNHWAWVIIPLQQETTPALVAQGSVSSFWFFYEMVVFLVPLLLLHIWQGAVGRMLIKSQKCIKQRGSHGPVQESRGAM